VLAAAVPQLLLLDAAPGLLHRLQTQLDHVEGVKDRNGVLELVAHGVGVAPEGIQRGDPDTGGERLPAAVEPVCVGASGPAGDQVEQPRPWSDLAFRIGSSGEIDHPSLLLRALARSRNVVPDVLVDTKDLDAGQAGRVVGQVLKQRPDR